MSQRAPDPFRPGSVPEGEPHGKLGRPAAALAAVLLVVIAIGLLFLLALR